MNLSAVLGFLSVVTSLIYGSRVTFQRANWRKTLLKAVPVACLFAIALAEAAPTPLVFALLCGVIGDIALSRDGPRNFLIGLSAFLLGHLFYIGLLASAGDIADGPDPLRLAAMVALAVMGGAVFLRLRSGFGALLWPVFAYVCVSVVLGWAALLLPLSYPLALAMLGALLFIGSDICLAFELFGNGSGGRVLPPVVWFSYWGGQALILAGFVLG